MRALVCASVFVGCVATEFVKQPDPTPCPVEAPPVEAEAAVRQAVTAFVTAVDQKDFSKAHALLDGSVRRRYSIERLQQDYVNEPRGQTLIAQLKASSSQRIEVRGDEAFVGTGPRAQLHLESGQWRIVFLESDRTKE